MSEDISIKNLTKIFKSKDKEVVAIKDFSLEIKKGELISIVGPSGCGKSTLLRCIAGLETPTSGTISSGNKIFDKPGIDRGMVFQDFALFPWRSVRKNVEYGLEINKDKIFSDVQSLQLLSAGKSISNRIKNRKIYKEERRARAEKMLKLVGLENFMDARVHELSGGMKQRVAIARVFATKPEIILMDEPFGALDAQTRNIMQAELRRLLDKTDQTVIFITHSVDEAVFLSDRIVILTKRPATIKEIIEVEWPHPRNRASPEFTALRKRILDELEKENVMI